MFPSHVRQLHFLTSDSYQTKKVTIVHGGSQLINNTYGNSLRNGLEQRLRARGVQIMFKEYIDDIPEEGVVGVTTRSGKRIEDADLVVRTSYVRINQLFIIIYRYLLVAVAQTAIM